jgi:hypothetical protein
MLTLRFISGLGFFRFEINFQIIFLQTLEQTGFKSGANPMTYDFNGNVVVSM